MESLKGVILDLDGTLLDSMWVWEALDVEFLAKRNLTVSKDYVEAITPMGFRAAAEYTIQRFGMPETPEEIMKEWQDMAKESYANRVKIKDGVKPVLQFLKDNGIRISVATASDEALFIPCLKNNGVYEYFSAFTTMREVERGKGFPDVYEKAAEKIGCNRENTIVFEDIVQGVKGAKAGGFFTVGVHDKYSQHDEAGLRKEADCYLKNWEQAIQICKSFMVKTALTIAGSDCSGGAGIQADLKTFAAHKVYGMSVISAVVAENTSKVFRIHKVPADVIASQLDAVFEDICPDSVKVGMLADQEAIQVVADKLKQYQPKHVVIDPVMVATSGHSLMEECAISNFKEKLLPCASILTPNIPEAEALTGRKIQTEEDMKQAAEQLHQMGAKTVLVKGGHFKGEALDIYYDGCEFFSYEVRRIPTKNTHGTGCTLSSAIAANLAWEDRETEAIKEAKEYITGAILHAPGIGKGNGPTNHFYKWNFIDSVEFSRENRNVAPAHLPKDT